jgi:glycosyltransferase involved in cell wall biosynthesis
MNCLWISWYAHRRTTGLCEAWSIPLQLVGSRRRGVLKWLDQSVRTIALLRRYRPDVLFVQNPSLGLTMLAVIVRRLFGYYLVVDAHNEGVRPFNRSGAAINTLTRSLLRRADATIVTNEALAADVLRAGGRPLVLPDRLPIPPALPAGPARSSGGAPRVVVVSTFAPDEPIASVMSAAASLPDVEFVITGNAQRIAGLDIAVPGNVRLAGFVPDQEYWELLAQAEVVCDLTLMPDCLVCGAYEALALGRPMVLSDNPPTRRLFGAAAVFTQSDAVSIAQAIRAALEQRGDLERRAREGRESFRAQWRSQADAVLADIRAAGGRSHTQRSHVASIDRS